MKFIEEHRNQFGTLILLLINLIFYFYMLIKYKTTTSTEALIETGANFGLLVAYQQQYWRWITAMFIHIGTSHLVMNMLMLYFMGQELEYFMGTARFVSLYLLSGFGGNILSFAFNSNISAGASTALFGMSSGYLVLSYLYPNNYYLKRRSQSFVVFITINIVFGILSTGIDMYGHMGGLLFGAIATYGLGAKRLSNQTSQKRNLILASGLYLICAGIFIFIGHLKYFL